MLNWKCVCPIVAAVSMILDSLDDIGCIVDGVATTDVEFLQYILQDHRLHVLLEVVPLLIFCIF